MMTYGRKIDGWIRMIDKHWVNIKKKNIAATTTLEHMLRLVRENLEI